ncbi:helix-turn-helix transcriptional regulator [Croceibacterium aestuarii]|uniref:helix-turn-helix transcriptional regulator n=1 Tax=Croceibacterium aestuarii TaxID=3064139 RepID=UPI00272E015A|nr:helix-turn-helix transcriptional regulator [Croceibacterium sp. D39]
MASDYEGEFARTWLEIDRRPHIAVSSDLALQFQCGRAGALLRDPLPVRIRNNRLRIEDEQRPGEFARFLQSCDATPRRFLLRAKSNGHWAMVFAWRPQQWENLIFLLFNLSMPHCDISDSGIVEDLRLTPAEIRVLELFLQLKVPRGIADELDVSISTVRSHLKQIYSKAAVQSGIQLHQLVRTYCAA